MIECDYCGDMVEKDDLAWTLEETGIGNYCYDNCYDEVVYCAACKDHHSRSELCWHVFEHPVSGEIMGAGWCPGDYECCKEAVINILTILGKEFAEKLKTAIEKQTYRIRIYTHSFSYNYQQSNESFLLEENGKDYYHVLEEEVFTVERRNNKDADVKYNLALDWLSSLEVGKTPEGEKMTIQWIDEYLNNLSSTSCPSPNQGKRAQINNNSL